MTQPKTYVPGKGPLSTCQICLIGEAPGDVENIMGEPFQGPAGELLNNLLSSAGIVRSECYITNVVKEQPDNNNIDHFIKFKGQQAIRSPKYDEYERILYDELNECSANVFVPMGNVALYAICRTTAITKRRGSILKACQIADRKCIPTIHPSAALRQYLHRYPILHDLSRVRQEAATSEISLPERRIHLYPTYHDAIRYLEESLNYERVATDIEVVNNSLSCFSVAISPFDIMVIPLNAAKGDYFTPDQEQEIIHRYAMLLECPTVQKINQNINFDLTFLHALYGICPKNIGDTMIAQAILWPDFPKGLDFICSNYTREPYYKDEGKKWFKIGGSYEQFWIYNGKDSAVVHEAFPDMMSDLNRSGNLPTYEHQLSLIEPLMYMQRKGIKVDVNGLKTAAEKAKDEITQLRAEWDRISNGVNPASTKQCMDYFYGRLRYTPYKDRKSGRPTIDKLALKRIARKGCEEASLLLRIRTKEKLSGTYYAMRLDGDGRLRTSYNPVGTSTGRLSSSKNIFGIGGNMQNLPPSFKRYLVADEGYVVFKVDLMQAEDRAVAYIAPEPNKQRAYELGIDPHCQTAGLIFNKQPDQVSKVEGSCALGGGLFSERDWGKRANHAFNYGMGPNLFSLMYECPLADSKFVHKKYHEAYPGLEQYYAWVRNQLQKDRILTTPYGRKRIFQDRWGEDMFKEAYAHIPQSTIGEHLNRFGVCELYYDQDSYRRVELLNQVHDSVEFQYPIGNWYQCAIDLLQLKRSLMTPIMWKATEFVVPADCAMGLNFKDVEKIDWFKNDTPETLSTFLELSYSKILNNTPDEAVTDLAEDVFGEGQESEEELDDTLITDEVI